MKALKPHGLGVAAAVVAAASMLVIGLLAMSGTYLEGYEAMKAYHLYFDATLGGTLLGMLEAAVSSYIAGYLFGWVYNKAS